MGPRIDPTQNPLDHTYLVSFKYNGCTYSSVNHALSLSTSPEDCEFLKKILFQKFFQNLECRRILLETRGAAIFLDDQRQLEMESIRDFFLFLEEYNILKTKPGFRPNDESPEWERYNSWSEANDDPESEE